NAPFDLRKQPVDIPAEMAAPSHHLVVKPMDLPGAQRIVFDVSGDHLPTGGTDIHRQAARLHPFTPRPVSVAAAAFALRRGFHSPYRSLSICSRVFPLVSGAMDTPIIR